ncbi:MAG: hypothetical protein IJN63_01270 [Clostridia bacterium]|nr:hypothetical protein [Clostridia bacterium]
MRKLISFLLASVVLACSLIPFNVNAALNYENVNDISTNVYFSNQTGTVTVIIRTTSPDAELFVNASLYVKATSGRWIDITPDWEEAYGNGSTFICDFPFDATNGWRYKVEVSALVCVSDVCETVTDSYEITYWE